MFSRRIQVDDKLWSFVRATNLRADTVVETIDEQLEVVPYPALAQASSITIKAVPALRNLSGEWTSCTRDRG